MMVVGMFLVFALMHSSLTLDNNEKVTNWILTGISSKKINPFDINLELTMSNLANGRVILKLTTLFQCKKIIFHWILTYFKFIHSLWIKQLAT